MKHLLLTLLMTSLVVGGVPAQKKDDPPAAWRLVNACRAEFRVPPDVQEEKVRGFDSCVRQYRGESMLIALDVVIYSDPHASRRSEYAEEQDFRIENAKVGGRDAEIITCHEKEVPPESRGLNYVAVLFVPQMRKDCCNLTIWAYSKSPEEREKALRIFQSVRFPKE